MNKMTPFEGRRSLLAASGALLGFGALTAAASRIGLGAPASDNPPTILTASERATLADSELIAAVAEYAALKEQCAGLLRGVTFEQEMEREPFLDAIQERQEALLDRISGMSAQTAAGLRAKALALRLWLPAMLSGDAPSCPDDALAWSLAADILRGVAAPPSPIDWATVKNLDAELLAACASIRDLDAARARAYTDDADQNNEMADRWAAALEGILHLRPHTAQGAKAKAGVAFRALMQHIDQHTDETWFQQATTEEALALITLGELSGTRVQL